MRALATLVGALMLMGATPALAQSADPNALAAQVSRGGGVTVTVTPKSLAAEAQQWEFELVLDTHTVDLSQDLGKSAALIDAAGRAHAPLAWSGDPPGGHHRKGVLSFKPLGAVDAVTLQIRDVGLSERTFRWPLKGQGR